MSLRLLTTSAVVGALAAASCAAVTRGTSQEPARGASPAPAASDFEGWLARSTARLRELDRELNRLLNVRADSDDESDAKSAAEFLDGFEESVFFSSDVKPHVGKREDIPDDPE